VPGERERFDTLFSDPRHERGDLRLMRTAIRRGWLDDAPQETRDALIERFGQAARERRDANRFSSFDQWTRVLLARCRLVIECDAQSNRETRARLRPAGFGSVGPSRTTPTGSTPAQWRHKPRTRAWP